MFNGRIKLVERTGVLFAMPQSFIHYLANKNLIPVGGAHYTLRQANAGPRDVPSAVNVSNEIV